MRTLAIAAIAVVACMPPSWGAGALLHPMRRPLRTSPALAHRDVVVDAGDELVLRGWLFPANGVRRRETIVYLHGVADNRESGTWIAERLAAIALQAAPDDSRVVAVVAASTFSDLETIARDRPRSLPAMRRFAPRLLLRKLRGGSGLQR
jgi:hypothetical protein